MSYPEIPLTYPPAPNSVPPIFPSNISDISMRHGSWDQQISNNGVTVHFYKSLPCPNLIGIDERVHPAMCPICGDDQYIYPLPHIVLPILLHTFSGQKDYNPQSMLGPGEVYFTFPAEYNGQVIDVAPWDRFVIQGVFTRTWGQFEYDSELETFHMSEPIHQVECLVSARSGVLKIWELGTEFILENENVKFLIEPNEGEVFSIMFYTYPAYTIVSLNHDIRLAQVLDGNIKRTVRLPQSGVAKRDFLIKDTQSGA